MRMGGLGLRVCRTNGPRRLLGVMGSLRCPWCTNDSSGVAQNAVIALEGDDELEGCLGELRVAAVGLD